MDGMYQINSEGELEATLGAPLHFVRAKIAHQLDDVMREFISRAPLAFVATMDAQGQVDISPKGDPAGFVAIDDDGHLLVPERIGNKLAFGLRNILANGKIGLIFVVPHQRESLRIKGTATIHRDPSLLDRLAVNGRPALLYTRVAVDECFFHCGKALIRSGLWKPEEWPAPTESLGARQFASLGGGGEAAVRATEQKLEDSYTRELY